MELNEKDFDKVVGGAHPLASEEMAKANEKLYRNKSIEDLKKMRDELARSEKGLEKDELTEDEIDKVEFRR